MTPPPADPRPHDKEVDYTDPEVPAAVSDAERAARAASASQREKEDPPPDPDRPSDEIWDGNTLTEP